jgi:hypothetical protein
MVIRACCYHDIQSLFHEFGHCLRADRSGWPQINGINNVEWDAVELPSQLLENWSWEEHLLDGFARHYYQTDEPLPHVLKQRLLRSQHFHKAMVLARQLEYAISDLRLHLDYTQHPLLTRSRCSNSARRICRDEDAGMESLSETASATFLVAAIQRVTIVTCGPKLWRLMHGSGFSKRSVQPADRAFAQGNLRCRRIPACHGLVQGVSWPRAPADPLLRSYGLA